MTLSGRMCYGHNKYLKFLLFYIKNNCFKWFKTNNVYKEKKIVKYNCLKVWWVWEIV